jgi:hypothetical protein
MTDMIPPIVHMNGTSREALEKQLLDLHKSLRATSECLSHAWPNGRDYYPEPGRMDRALPWWVELQATIGKAIQDIEACHAEME